MPVEQRSWYAIKTYSGYEDRVKKNLEHRQAILDGGGRIFRIELPPVEEGSANWKSQFLKGRNVYGYVLVETLADDASQDILRNMPGVLSVEKLDIRDRK